MIIDARRHAGQQIAPVIPIGSLARYDRPAPTLSAYDDTSIDCMVTAPPWIGPRRTPAWTESSWVWWRLGLLDSDQGLVGPFCSVERGFVLRRW